MVRQAFATETGIMFSARGLRKLGLDLDPVTYHPLLTRPPALEMPSDTYLQPIPKPEKLTLEQHEAKVKADMQAEAEMSELEIDLKDSMSPVYDQLKLAPFWWMLEFLPAKHRYQRADGTWAAWLGFNLGRGRHIPKQSERGVKVHRTVKYRLETTYENGSSYYPNANLNLDKVTWVD
jgi:hypothetical protein